MSYAASAALQAAIFQTLASDATVAALTGGAIYDAVPSGQIPPLYVSLGPEDVRDRSDQTGAGAVHDFTVSVVSDTAGFSAAKEVAAAISDALVDAPPPLARGRILSLTFSSARARRVGRGTRRRIDLRFLARVADA